MGDVDAELNGAWAQTAAEIHSASAAGMPLTGIALGAPHHELGVSLVDARTGTTITTAGDVPPDLATTAALLADDYRTIAVNGGRMRTLARPLEAPSDVVLVANASLASLDASLERLRLLLILLGVGGISVALLGGWAIAGSALRPIAMLTQTARAIADSRTFARRVPALRRGDELGRLAGTFNDMLASLDAAHQLQQRFVSDTSHELRTPLTTVHGNAQLLVQDDADPVERREAAAQILRETRRLTRLIDDLLALARADAGTEPLEAKRVELDEVLMEAFEELRPQAGHRLRVVALDEAPVLGERDHLKQLVLILLDNALRYTPPDGSIEASIATEDGTVVLRVDDTGIGIDSEVEAHAFDRFYRGESARRLDPQGTGLGLSIARWIVERHGGSVQLLACRPRGTRAIVTLPSAASDATDVSAQVGL